MLSLSTLSVLLDYGFLSNIIQQIVSLHENYLVLIMRYVAMYALISLYLPFVSITIWANVLLLHIHSHGILFKDLG